jgi:hypothetical protein
MVLLPKGRNLLVVMPEKHNRLAMHLGRGVMWLQCAASRAGEWQASLFEQGGELVL